MINTCGTIGDREVISSTNPVRLLPRQIGNFVDPRKPLIPVEIKSSHPNNCLLQSPRLGVKSTKKRRKFTSQNLSTVRSYNQIYMKFAKQSSPRFNPGPTTILNLKQINKI
eukprot:TRINITY_DN1849_c5_g1_i1.p1 TRINITY_DN1849_c5_g1~~TRINITY_DN1849_c5_g1_i1.p1  ORF type:complete len:111 (-),score=2.94 TRINITY_DN1849_c5_g1_i1:2509-2841(-)